MDLRLIGYWRSDPSGEWPDPATLIDPAWDEDERLDVGHHLQHGLIARAYLGHSPCRLCDRTSNGNLELTDGVYIWPEGLAHYVLDHNVRLPGEFLDHIRQQGETFADAEIKTDWWRSQSG